jgi:hypothetical protein
MAYTFPKGLADMSYLCISSGGGSATPFTQFPEMSTNVEIIAGSTAQWKE